VERQRTFYCNWLEHLNELLGGKKNKLGWTEISGLKIVSRIFTGFILTKDLE
jgi:hypothetical protein